MNKNEIYYGLGEYKYLKYENENLYTIDWFDLETIEYLDKFKKRFKEKYEIILDLCFLVLAGIDFTDTHMSCGSCAITEKWFDSFEDFLMEKAKYYNEK
jgi:hypothetical protein